MSEITIKIHKIATDGLPDMDALTGRVAFIFDGFIVSGWPLERTLEGETLWEGNTDVSHDRPMMGVTHWVEFPAPLWEIERE
jgi:hypothetical protein